MTLSVGGNKTLRIAAQNLGDASYSVQSMKVNEQVWNKSWISHSDIVGGWDSARLSLCWAVRRRNGRLDPYRRVQDVMFYSQGSMCSFWKGGCRCDDHVASDRKNLLLFSRCFARVH